MRYPFALLLVCLLVVFAIPAVTIAQNATAAQPPTPGADGVYEIPASELQKLETSPKIEFPRELSSYEIADTVTLALTISPDGKVKTAKAIAGKIDTLKAAAEKSARKWSFQPYLANGNPVAVRTEVVVNFDNTFDNYRDPDGDVPVRLDRAAGEALLVKSVPPQYPSAAQLGRIQGPVDLRVIIGKDGKVQALHIIKGHPLLAPAAYAAVRQWKYNPYVDNGKPLPVDTKLIINFAWQ